MVLCSNVIGDNRYDLLKNVVTDATPAIIVARGLPIPDEMISVAKKRDTVLLQSTEPTSRLNGAITAFLDEKLSTRTTVHGVLMDILGWVSSFKGHLVSGNLKQVWS